MSKAPTDYQGFNESVDAAEGNARQGAADAVSHASAYGGLPDYTALMNAIQQLGKSQVSLPDDIQLQIDNSAMQQLGAQKSMQALQRGEIAKAQSAQMQDRVSQNAVSGNLQNTRKAALQEASTGSDVANQESAQNAQIGQKTNLALASNQLREFALKGKAHHANMQIQNSAAGLGEAASNANQQGIMAVQQAGQSAQSNIDAISLNQSAADWGNTMSLIRSGLSAISSAGSAAVDAYGKIDNSPTTTNSGNPTGSSTGDPYISVTDGVGTEDGQMAPVAD